MTGCLSATAGKVRIDGYHIFEEPEKAKKLIEENNDLRIKDIADAVGFKEAYYFSKTFKRETGMWPTEYSARDK